LAAGAAGYWFLGEQNLAGLINAGSGSASVATRTAQAIGVASRQLEGVQRPDVAVRLSETAVQQILAAYKDKLHEDGIDGVTLSLAPQRVRLAGKIALTLPNIPSVGDLKIEGHVDGAAAVTFSSHGLLIAPAFEHVLVDRAAVRHGINLGVVLPAVNAGLDVFLSRVNGSLTALGPRLIDLGAGPIWDPGSVSPGGSAAHGADAPKFWLDRSALLIDDDGVRALGAFAYQAGPPQRQPAKPPEHLAEKEVNDLFEAYRRAFDTRWLATFPPPGLDQPASIAFRPRFIAEALGARWPPVDPHAGRWQAVSSAVAHLGSLDRAGFAIRLQVAPLIAVAKERMLAQMNEATAKQSPDRHFLIDGLDIVAGKQSIDTAFTLKYDDPNLSLAAGVAGHIAPVVENTWLHLIPVFDTIVIREAATRNAKVDLAAAVLLANDALSELLTTINGALVADDVIKPVDIGLKGIAPIDVGKELAKIPGVVSASGPVIDPSFRYEDPVLLIDISSIQVIGRLALGASVNAAAVALPTPVAVPSAAEVDSTLRKLEDRFIAARNSVDEPSEDVPVWIAVRRDAIGGLLGNLLAHFDRPACATYGIQFSAPYNLDLKSFSGSLPDCTPRMACDLQVDTRDCRRAPHCERHPDDTRDCSACILGNPFTGGCTLRGNDPICEALKGTQNGVYASQYAACQGGALVVNAECEVEKGTQNGIYAGQKAACEADKGRLKVQCEALKGLQQQLQVLAHVGGEVHASGSANLCVPGITVDPNLSHLGLDVSLAGHGISLGGRMDYTPIGIPGTLLGCVIPWSRPLSASVDIRNQQKRLTADLSSEQTDHGLALKFVTGDISIEAEMQPPPFEAIFAEHPDLAVICPVLFGVGGTATLLNSTTFAASGKDLVPELRGELQIPVKAATLAVMIAQQKIPIDQKLMLVGTPRITDSAIVFSGSVQSR
jgi:hypothetical protein